MSWLILFLALTGSFVYSGVEAGLLSLHPVRLRRRADEGVRVAIRLQRALAKPARLYMSALVAANLCNIVALVFWTRELHDRVGGWAFPLAALTALPVYLVFLEFLPKTLFRHNPLKLLLLSTPLLLPWHTLLSPIFGACDRCFAATAPGGAKSDGPPTSPRQELRFQIEQSRIHGAISETECRLIQHVLDFHKVTVRQAMIPMEKVVALRDSDHMDDLRQLARQTSLERLPVLDGNGRPVGLIRVFETLLEDRDTSLRPFMRRIVATTEGEPAAAVIARLRQAGVQLATVTDPAGKALGIVSEQDLVALLIDAGLE